MKAVSANAIYISNIYSQESGDTNWIEYQAIVTMASSNINIRTIDTSATNLSLLDVSNRVYSGNTIYVTTDGSNVVSGTISSVTSGTIKTQTGTYSVNTSKSNTSSIFRTYRASTTSYGDRGYKLKADGKYFWLVSDSGILYEFALATPGNFNSATATGKSFSAFGYLFSGFDFSPDGRFLFGMSAAYSKTIMRFKLGTPWDISTVSNIYKTINLNSNWSAQTTWNSLKVKPDGTQFFITYAGNIYATPILPAWEISTLQTPGGAGLNPLWTYTLPAGPQANSFTWDWSYDGKTFIWFSWASYISGYIYAATAATPWDIRTIGPAITLTVSNSTYISMYSSNGNYPMGVVLNRDGSVTLLNAPGWGTGHAHFDVDVLTSSNVSITGLSLSAAPTQAWLAPPSINVHSALTSNIISCSTKELDLDISVGGYTGSNATTTSATIGIDGAGVLTVGDTITLNNTTTVTLTGVTETANGLVRQDPGTSIDYIKWNNKSFVTGLTNGFVRMTSDGTVMYVLGYSSTFGEYVLYQYTLSVPFDVSTAVWNNKNYISSTDLDLSNGGARVVSGFDINPNGTSLTLLICTSFGLGGTTTSTGQSVTMNITYIPLSSKNNLDSASNNYTYTYTWSPASVGATAYGLRYNPTGTQLVITNSSNGTTSKQGFHLFNLTTAYNPSTITSVQTTWNSMGSSYGFTTEGTFTPDGLNFLTIGDVANTYTIYANAVASSNVFTRNVTNAGDFTSVAWGVFAANTAPYRIDFPSGSGLTNSVAINSIEISRDGTKLYLLGTTGTIYQFSVRTKSLTKYAVTFTTQAGTPSSVWLPDRSTNLSMSPSASANNLILTSNLISANARTIQYKLQDTYGVSEVSTVRINLKKSQ